MKLEVLLKFLVVVFSGVILVAGAAGLLGGFWTTLSPSSIVALLGRIDGGMPAEDLEAFLSLSELLMAGGALLLVVGFLGCYGALRGRRPALLLHFVLVLMLFAAELAGAVAAVGFTDQLAARAVDDIKRDYGRASSGYLTQFWTVTMDVVGCCGVHNYTDFIGSPKYARSETFPSRCCEADVAPPLAHCDSQLVHNASVTGCLPKTRELISENRRLVAIVVMSVMYVEICAMVVSMILYCRFRLKRLVVPDTT